MLPQLFYTTQIPVCLWFLACDEGGGGSGSSRTISILRDRCGETLFIDARKVGHMMDRTHRDLSDEDVEKITRAYQAWRGEPEAGEYEDVPGVCKCATLEEIASHSHVLTPLVAT